jgi:AraC family transcriptional regulator of adaptative response / DNA-3-methyladenine glycosylase II
MAALDPRVCDRARRARDARFDGRFFVAVTSTGIYCRPICPAPSPLDKHVRYYPSAAAAAEAGFRPCLRCRPEASPGTPAWNGTSAIVGRAVRLIGEGALADGGVEPLAARLGVGPRHLHRLFVQHLGAPPVVVAQTARIEMAKRLIDETALPMTTIAHAAGFGSIRRFNDAFQRAYHRPPGAIRRALAHPPAGEGRTYRLRLAYRPPYDWNAILAFLAGRAITGVEAVDAGVYRRTISWKGDAGTLAVSHRARSNSLEVAIDLAAPAALPCVVGRVRTLFDLAADPHAIAAALRKDARLRPVVSRSPGLRLPGCWDPFEVAVRAVVGQQVSVRAASTIMGRLVERAGLAGPPLGSDGAPGRMFPTPEALANADLSGLGLTSARAATLTALAGAVATGAVRLDAGRDTDMLVGELTAIRGIGSWTAHYVAMRGLGDPDAFPAEDLGLRSGAARLAGTPHAPARRMTTRDLVAMAEPWRPWRAYAAMHLWHMLTPGEP